MTPDIVERLRKFYGDAPPVTGDEAICHEAAAEILALRQRVERAEAEASGSYRKGLLAARDWHEEQAKLLGDGIARDFHIESAGMIYLLSTRTPATVAKPSDGEPEENLSRTEYLAMKGSIRGKAMIRDIAAENVKLRSLLKDCADDLEAEINARYDRVLHVPAMRKDYDRDMETVNKAREALTAPPASEATEVRTADITYYKGPPIKGTVTLDYTPDRNAERAAFCEQATKPSQPSAGEEE